VRCKRWLREQMVDSFRQRTAMHEPSIETEVDRYIPLPGQALACILGQARIVELRQRAHDALGDKFDPPAFRDALLADSPLPV
jgi:uncharacterized protein (DUF885 family)